MDALDWTVQCHAELNFWNDNLRSLNGARMRVEGTVKHLDVRDLVSDAGGMLVGVTEFRGGVEDVSKRMQEPLSEDDLGESSTFCELCALEMALQARGESLSGQAVRWVTDSQSSCHYSEGGQYETWVSCCRCAGLGFGACAQHHTLLWSGCRILPQRSWSLTI